MTDLLTPPLDFVIPDAALGQHIGVLGKTGSGKTSTEKLIVERVVDQGFRVCILDPIKSDWWGVTSSADGLEPGLPFRILGGPHGHVPLHSSAGAAVGQIVGSGKLPLSIIDMAEFEPGGPQRFFTEFAPSLMRHMRGVVYLVIEEAHEFAPKERAGFGDENLAIHWAKKLATAGRSKGIRLIVATQRTQSLHNAVLGSCETVIAHRLTAPADQKPVLDWLKANVSRNKAAEIGASLSSLRTGTGWVCAGEAQFFAHVQFPKFRTYDNAATPQSDDEAHHVATATVDQEELRAIIGRAVEEAEANDPKKLREEIARLKKELSSAGGAQDPGALAAAEAAGLDRGLTEGRDQGAELGRAALDRCLAFIERAREELGASPVAAPVPEPKAPPGQAAELKPRLSVAAPEAAGADKAILGALTWWEKIGERAPTRIQVCAIAGLSPKSSGTGIAIGGLKARGLVDYPASGRVSLTEDGRTAAPSAPQGEIRDFLPSILNETEQRVVDHLLSVGGETSREDLCAALNLSPKSSGTGIMLGRLKTLQVISYPAAGRLLLAPWAMGR